MPPSTTVKLCRLLLFLASPAYSVTTGRAGHGFVGYGISMYQPPCAHACRATISNPLNCSVSSDHMHHMHMEKRMGMHSHSDMEMQMGDGWMIEASPTPECYASNDAFLQTMALCMSLHCLNESNSTLQRYWELDVPGRLSVQPLPKQSYQEALRAIHGTPAPISNSSTILQSVGGIPEDIYMAEYRTLSVFEKIETNNAKYGLVLLLTGAIIPIGLSLVRFLPIPASWTIRFTSTFIDAPSIGSRHNVPYIWGTFIMPTRGQALFIAYQIAINIILCGVGIQTGPSTWYPSVPREVVSYISNRAGYLSFANIPLLVLFSSRNNFLLWLTNWSHSTFLLLHRWIATIAVIEACLHSAIYLQIYHVDGNHTAESQLPYWFWGIIATLSMVVILPASVLPIRRKFYEAFLAWHVLFFLLTLIACLLHIYYRYAWQWGYENWIYMAFGIWGFDRVLRIIRLSRHGICSARITIIDDEYIKLEIPGVHAEGHAYLYFPTLTWRVWENHPFSILTNTCIEPEPTFETKDTSTMKTLDAGPPLECTDSDSEARQHSQGLTIYLATLNGITAHLRTRTTFPVLVESSYQPPSITSPRIISSPNILAFAGGVGITALTSTLLQHTGHHKLFWASRSKALVSSVSESLSMDGFNRLNPVVFCEERMCIPRILAEEVRRCKGGVVVMVSGPGRMADEVRLEVCRLAAGGAEVVLVEESFSW